MADKKISQLTAAAALTGTEVVPIVQSGDTVKATTQNIANLFSLGYTAENVANKSTTTSLGTSNTLYPTQNAVKVYADTVAAAAAAGKELLANKSINTALGTSDTLYPTQNAVKVYVDGSVAGLLDDRGSYTPSVSSPGAYPSTGGSGTAGAIMKGDLWFMSASGFLGTTAVAAGATVRALVNTPGQTGANWNILSAGSISITTPNLQQVTTAGATTSNNLTVNSDGGAIVSTNAVSDSSRASLNAFNGQGGSLQLTNTFTSIGTIKADNLGLNRTYQLPDASGTLALTSDVGLPYKVYSAIVSYNADTLNVISLLQNTLGATITWGKGFFYEGVASSSVFTNNKTIITASPYRNSSNVYTNIGFRSNDSQVNLLSYISSGTDSVALGITFFLEIRVYP